MVRRAGDVILKLFSDDRISGWERKSIQLPTSVQSASHRLSVLMVRLSSVAQSNLPGATIGHETFRFTASYGY